MPSAQKSSTADYVAVTRADLGDLSGLDDEATEHSVNPPAPQRSFQQRFNMHQRTVQQETLLSFDDELQQNYLVSTLRLATRNDER